ncbi:MAG: hypothetical protein IPO44_00035 [Candidatus Microthrix sp.]|nr:hypothetical protein [Candidatus Microthrix sp.]MBK9558022.1 hypothetical protein [Candidatus Microthrix sp.]
MTTLAAVLIVAHTVRRWGEVVFTVWQARGQLSGIALVYCWPPVAPIAAVGIGVVLSLLPARFELMDLGDGGIWCHAGTGHFERSQGMRRLGERGAVPLDVYGSLLCGCDRAAPANPPAWTPRPSLRLRGDRRRVWPPLVVIAGRACRSWLGGGTYSRAASRAGAGDAERSGRIWPEGRSP